MGTTKEFAKTLKWLETLKDRQMICGGIPGLDFWRCPECVKNGTERCGGQWMRTIDSSGSHYEKITGGQTV